MVSGITNASSSGFTDALWFCPPRQRKWKITWKSDTVSAPLTLVDGFVWGNWWWSCQAHLILWKSASLSCSQDSCSAPFWGLLTALIFCQRHLEETIWQFLGVNILLFKSHYSSDLIAARGNFPEETNPISWHHQTDFPKGGRAIPHPFCPAAFQRLQHCGHT